MDALSFLGVAALVIVTPGQDTALTIRNSLLGGRRSGVFTALGISTGQCGWALATSAGLAALLAASEPAFLAIRLLGGAYLVYLGALALWSAARRAGPREVALGFRSMQPRQAFRQGLLSNLGNPKMAVFFSSLLPQFAHSFAGLLVLGIVFAAMTVAWLAAYACVVSKAGDVLRRPRVRRLMDAVVGTVLVAFGARLAAESR